MTLMKAGRRMQAELAGHEAESTETLVTWTVADLPAIRLMQGRIAGLRQAIEAIDEMCKRYEDGDDDAGE